jgi:hypothetical protein
MILSGARTVEQVEQLQNRTGRGTEENTLFWRHYFRNRTFF